MNIISGKVPSAQKIVIYGPEGIGKSSLAARFPDPIFIDTEGSTKQLSVKRFEKPSSWEMLLEMIRYVIQNRPCKTLIVDTVDWAETMCLESVCKKHGKAGIEDFGYGNGYVYEKEEFGRFLNLLEEVIGAGINVVLTAHAILRKFEQPDEMGSYDRWELKLGKKTTNLIAPMVKEWADAVLFCNYKTYSVAVDKDGKKHKAQGGKRVMYTAHHPCWDAKNRYGLSEETEMDYEIIKPYIESADVKPAPVIETPKTNKIDIDTIMDDTTEAPTPTAKSIDTRIPKALRDLMENHGITEAQIQKAVSDKGYYPADMPIWDYSPDFIQGCLVAAWGQVFEMITGDKLFN